MFGEGKRLDGFAQLILDVVKEVLQSFITECVCVYVCVRECVCVYVCDIEFLLANCKMTYHHSTAVSPQTVL